VLDSFKEYTVYSLLVRSHVFGIMYKYLEERVELQQLKLTFRGFVLCCKSKSCFSLYFAALLFHVAVLRELKILGSQFE